jgi:hypothetical protein
MYNLTPYEKETIILFNDDSDMATVYTCNRSIINKLQGFCDKNPNTYKLTKSDECSKTFEMPKKMVSFRSKKVTNNRVMSEEHKQKMMLARNAKHSERKS